MTRPTSLSVAGKVCFLVFSLLAHPVHAQDDLNAGVSGKSQASSSVFVYIDIQNQTMTVTAQDPEVSYEWKVSTGMPGHQTPGGTFEPLWFSKMHYSSIYENAPMPHSIFFVGGYAIHGTHEDKKLGRPVSHGCVRLAPQNAKLLFNLIQLVGKENAMIHIEP